MRLDRVGGDGNDGTLLALKGGGKRTEEAGRHRQEITLKKKGDQTDKEGNEDEGDLIEDEHSIDPAEVGQVKVLDLASQASQTSEGGRKISRLHPSISSNLDFFSFKLDNLPVQRSNTY